MLRRGFGWILPLVLTVGSCGGKYDGSGVWMFVADPATEICEEGIVTHNFADAGAAEELESDWDTQDLDSLSPTLFFGQLMEGPTGDAVLLIDDKAYPGIFDGDTWTFSWTSTESATHLEDFLTEYHFEQSTSSAWTTTLEMTLTGDTATGAFETTTTTSTLWRETDVWSETVDVSIGQLPAADYLVWEDDAGTITSTTNESDQEDCLESRCELQIHSVCTTSAPFSASRTGWASESDYPGLEDAGQTGGN